MVPVAKAGVNDPALMLKAERLALLDAAARVTVTVYVLMVTPSCAITTTGMALAPTASVWAAEAVPVATAVPFTVIVALASLAVGVMVMEETPYATDAVYDVVAAANAGASVPLLKASAERLSLLGNWRVTSKAYVVVGEPPVPVTTTSMVFCPTLKAMAPEALPEVTATPFTLTVEVDVVTVGVTVIDDTVLASETAYSVVPVAKAGLSVPALTCSADSADAAGGAVTLILRVACLLPPVL